MRTLASVVVTEQPTQAAEDGSEQHKQHKEKPDKQKKPKHDKARKDDVALPPARRRSHSERARSFRSSPPLWARPTRTSRSRT